MKYQSFLIKKINPTKTELSSDYEIGNTLHNRIISNVRPEIIGSVVKLINKDKNIIAIISLNKYYIENICC